jgi:hypothetical protein
MRSSKPSSGGGVFVVRRAISAALLRLDRKVVRLDR